MKIISIGSQDDSAATPVVGLETMLRALPLIHKYDCKGAVNHLLPRLQVAPFPEFPSGGLVIGQQLKELGQFCPFELSTNRCYYVAPSWLTQTHLDYIVRKEELCGSSSLNDTMKKILAHALVGRVVDPAFLQQARVAPGLAHKLGLQLKDPGPGPLVADSGSVAAAELHHDESLGAHLSPQESGKVLRRPTRHV